MCLIMKQICYFQQFSLAPHKSDPVSLYDCVVLFHGEAGHGEGGYGETGHGEGG